MKIIDVKVVGKFDTERVRDREHWRNIRDIQLYWSWRDNEGFIHEETVILEAGFIWDGASRPNFIGWLIPRGGVFLLASGIHDLAFKTRFFLSTGKRISRQHADLLFLALMHYQADRRVNHGWKEPAQIVMAEVMYWSVRQFGEPVWDKHDSEFRA